MFSFQTIHKHFKLITIILVLVLVYIIYALTTNFNLPVTKIRTQLKLTEQHDKWIVVTSINEPTSDVKKLSNLKGWKVVVVGDTKSPAKWSHPNCIFLDVDTQLQLGYETTNLIKYRSYARKNIGYLFAIENGAKIIYDTDDDNSPTTDNIGFDPFLNSTYLKYYPDFRKVANPYTHFGQSSVWPRGYPLDKISVKPLRTYHQCRNQNVLVQQGVVNGDPDVDAIFRLTRKDDGVDLKITFDSNVSPLMFPHNLISPYNSQNTLHLYDAFWGLLLPQTVAFRVCDIWRSYWAQRLLWDIGGNIGFFPPNAYTYRNAHSFLEDFIDEEELYHKSSYLVDFLIEWESENPSFYGRVIELAEEMQKKDFWKQDDVKLVKYWLRDLEAIGYTPPLLVTKRREGCNETLITKYPKEQPSSYLRLQTKLKTIA